MISNRKKITVQPLTSQGEETDLSKSTPAERLDMMWQLALDAWAFKGEPVIEPRLPRHVIRIERRES